MNKLKKLIIQLFKFGIVGVIAFVVDYGFMVLFTEVFGVHYMASSTASFLISVVVNYLLSMRYVFQRKEDLDRKAEFIIFVILSAVGLGVNELCMWLFTSKLGVAYYFSKIGATAIVMIWNFVSRKIFLEKHN